MAWDSNREHILAAIGAARGAGANILCLPETCISGYGCEDAFFANGVQQTSLEVLAQIVPETQGLAVSLGLPLMWEGKLYNAAALACDGRLLGFVCKQHLAGDGIHYEPRWFSPWPTGKVSEIHFAGKKFPIGDLLFDCDGVQVGFEICRDAWIDDRPGKRLAARGADVILNPSASHFALAKQEVRRQIVLDGSRDFHVGYVCANLLGNESGRAIYDGGTLIASEGQMLAEGPRFSYADYVLTIADVEKKVSGTFSGNSGNSGKRFLTPFSKEEEFARAVPLALFDYLRKSRAGGLVISLSGGADSSATATLVWLMVQLGTNDIGQEAFTSKLAHVAGLAEAKGSNELVRRLLTCVYQATRNSSETTRSAAQAVADAIGAEFLHWNVDAMVDGYVETISQAVGRQLDWQHDDLALQNIQARARGPAAWLLANLRGALLLATSNRSEAAVGYATMDGDTCGGLSPIAGIDKAFLLEWLKWMETTGPEGVGPLPALAVVNTQQPTAELRPPGAGQTDEADLMPYRVLDAIERSAIRDKLMPVEVFEVVRPQFEEYDAQQIGAWIERFFRLWCRNQWKRERFAPSFHLDDENLDPKTWCRFPILSGGFERELTELREHLAER